MKAVEIKRFVKTEMEKNQNTADQCVKDARWYKNQFTIDPETGEVSGDISCRTLSYQKFNAGHFYRGKAQAYQDLLTKMA